MEHGKTSHVDDFKCHLLSHGKIDSYRVAISYFGTKDFKMVTIACDQKGRILIVDIVLNDTNILSLFSS